MTRQLRATHSGPVDNPSPHLTKKVLRILPAMSVVLAKEPKHTIHTTALSPRRRSRRLQSWFPPLLAACPGLAGIIGVCLTIGNGRYLPYGDQAVAELFVRDVGDRAVLVGPYSRFGFYHPGPLMYYLLAGPYRLLGQVHQSLAIGALLIGAISSAAIVALVRRHAGNVPGFWAALVLAVTVRLLVEPGFLRDAWNPYLPLLPFVLYVVLCWAAICGDAWALPVAVLPASLAVQSHVGYLLPVLTTAAVTSLALAQKVHRNRRRVFVKGGWPRRRAVVAAATIGIAVLVWLPPIIQQMTSSPGNLGVLLSHFRHQPGDSTVAAGLRAVADEMAKLPSYAFGLSAPRRALVPQDWPPVMIGLGLGLFVAAVAVALRRRHVKLLWLAALTLATAGAGVLAVRHIEGPPFLYITQWTVAIGILGWTVIGGSLLPEIGRVLHHCGRLVPLAGTFLATLAVAATLVTAVSTARAETPQTDSSGDVQTLERAVLSNLDESPGGRQQVVRVDYASTTKRVVVGTSFAGSGVVLALVRDGVDVQLSPFWELPFGAQMTARVDRATYVATIAYSDGTSPPPLPGQRLLAVRGDYQVYGGPIAGRPASAARQGKPTRS